MGAGVLVPIAIGGIGCSSIG